MRSGTVKVVILVPYPEKNMSFWKVQSSRYLLKRPWLRLREDHVVLPSGVEIEEFHVAEYPDWACVLCITTGHQVVLAEQYRHGVSQLSMELPAGAVDPLEEPLEAARRELLEETGYEAKDWTLLGRCAQDPGRQTNFAHLFLARDAEQVAAPKLDGGEQIRVRLFNLDEAMRLAESGAIIHGIHLAAFFWAMRRDLLSPAR